MFRILAVFPGASPGLKEKFMSQLGLGENQKLSRMLEVVTRRGRVSRCRRRFTRNSLRGRWLSSWTATGGRRSRPGSVSASSPRPANGLSARRVGVSEIAWYKSYATGCRRSPWRKSYATGCGRLPRNVYQPPGAFRGALHTSVQYQREGPPGFLLQGSFL